MFVWYEETRTKVLKGVLKNSNIIFNQQINLEIRGNCEFYILMLIVNNFKPILICSKWRWLGDPIINKSMDSFFNICSKQRYSFKGNNLCFSK